MKEVVEEEQEKEEAVIEQKPTKQLGNVGAHGLQVAGCVRCQRLVRQAPQIAMKPAAATAATGTGGGGSGGGWRLQAAALALRLGARRWAPLHECVLRQGQWPGRLEQRRSRARRARTAGLLFFLFFFFFFLLLLLLFFMLSFERGVFAESS